MVDLPTPPLGLKIAMTAIYILRPHGLTLATLTLRIFHVCGGLNAELSYFELSRFPN
jgi:hypothetical protein